jgi:hypothetical protein
LTRRERLSWKFDIHQLFKNKFIEFKASGEQKMLRVLMIVIVSIQFGEYWLRRFSNVSDQFKTQSSVLRPPKSALAVQHKYTIDTLALSNYNDCFKALQSQDKTRD